MKWSRRQGFTLVELLIVFGCIAIVVALVLPGLIASRRASNERNSSTSLKTLSSAEADFRANDRDGNGVNDFWTGDVKGLYTMTSAAVQGARGLPNDPPIKLIELAVAAADADAGQIPASGENMPLATFASHEAKDGYRFAALLADRSAAPGDPERMYKLETGGSIPMGRCHNRSRFGFVAIPASSMAGHYFIWVNENNSLFWTTRESMIGPGLILRNLTDGSSPGLDWPDDNTLKSCFSRR